MFVKKRSYSNQQQRFHFCKYRYDRAVVLLFLIDCVLYCCYLMLLCSCYCCCPPVATVATVAVSSLLLLLSLLFVPTVAVVQFSSLYLDPKSCFAESQPSVNMFAADRLLAVCSTKQALSTTRSLAYFCCHLEQCGIANDLQEKLANRNRLYVGPSYC